MYKFRLIIEGKKIDILPKEIKKYLQEILRVENLYADLTNEEVINSIDWQFVFEDFDFVGSKWSLLNLFSKKERGGFWIYPMLYPESETENIRKRLPDFSIDWHKSAYSHYSNRYGDGVEPFWNEKKGFLKSEIPIYFNRTYYGNQEGEEDYIEINQMISHLLCIHLSKDKRAYSFWNSLGEETEVIKNVEDSNFKMMMIRRDALDKILYLGKWELIRYFCYDRIKGDLKILLNTSDYESNHKSDNLVYKVIRNAEDNSSYIKIRGGNICRPIGDKDTLLDWRYEVAESTKRYASFIIQDWKNKKTLKDYSIDPNNFCSYFDGENELPHELSPIFFNAEVLDKYKNDSKKYELEDRTISCRGGWGLQFYDINEYTQVHAYAIDLSGLPYKEQLHWKLYNEYPLGDISERALKTDFKGEWSDQISKTEKLKEAVEKISKITFKSDPIFYIKDLDKQFKKIHMVQTENENQRQEFIGALTIVTNQGFKIKTLESIVKSYDIDTEGQKGKSLFLIKKILEKTGHPIKIHKTLDDLQKMRSSGKPHKLIDWKTPDGSIIEDSEKIIDDVTEAILSLADIFESLEQKANCSS